MSAIWGIIANDNDFDIEIINKMGTIYQSYCKVDRIEKDSLKNCYMGCAIQYITKESVSEKLPFIDDENEVAFTADCIVDNRSELIEKLGVADSSVTDSNLIFQAYRTWGIDCVKQIRGLFSFVIHDRRKNVTYLVADQLSNRCLYYYYNNEKLIFSTLIEPIIIAKSDISVNENYIKDYLTAPGLMPNLISDETPYKGIMKVNCGCYIQIDNDGLKEVEYWNPSMPMDDIDCKSASEYGKYFRKLYESCVEDAIRTSGKVAAAMSSGLDSATVATIAANKLKEKNQQLNAYTYVPFDKDVSTRVHGHVCDETQSVLQIVEHNGNIVPHFCNNEGKSSFDEIDKFLKIMEIPFKAFVNLPSLGEIYGKSYEDGCRVILTGQAGNSTVSHGYIDDVLYELYSNHRYIEFLIYLNKYCILVKESRKAAFDGCVRYFRYADNISKDTNRKFEYRYDNKFLTDSVLDNYPQEERYKKAGVTVFEKIPMNGNAYRDGLYKKAIYTYLGELDTKMGLHYGIVLRDPTRDMRIMQFCYRMPYELYAYNGVPRWLIRSNCRDLIPHVILDDYMRYGVQNADWFKRIAKSIDTVIEKIRIELNNDIAHKIVNIEKAEEFLKKVQCVDNYKDNFEFEQINFACIAIKFLSWKNNQ